MKKIYFIIWTVVVATLFVSCEKDEEARLSTISVSSETFTPSYNSVLIETRFETKAASDHYKPTLKTVYVQYSTRADFAEYEEALMNGKDYSYKVQLNDLQDNTTYYIRYVASNRYSSAMTEEINNFKTLEPLPIIEIISPTDVSYTSATIGGNVIDDCNLGILECGIVYDFKPHPTISNNKTVCESDVDSFSCNLTNLLDGTTYYVRAYAVNKCGIGYSEEQIFTTREFILNTYAMSISNTSVIVGSSLDEYTYGVKRGFVYSIFPNPSLLESHSKTIKSGSLEKEVFCYLSNLLENTTYYIRAFAIHKDSIEYGNEISIKTSETTTPEYVDLGLSVKWATFNIGASKPEEYGDYFAWGETEPKHQYNWETYLWAYGDAYSLFKYCTNNEYGTIDNLRVLNISDDAASINWGNLWRIPAWDEIKELETQCFWNYTIQNGVRGYQVMSKKNNNSIFLPLAGYVHTYNEYDDSDHSFYSSGIEGLYWINEVNSGWCIRAQILDMDSANVDTYESQGRLCGLPIRPVYP